MTDDVTLWSKLEYMVRLLLILLILFHRRTIFKMLELEQSAKTDLLVPGGVVQLLRPLQATTGLDEARRTLKCATLCLLYYSDCISDYT